MKLVFDNIYGPDNALSTGRFLERVEGAGWSAIVHRAWETDTSALVDLEPVSVIREANVTSWLIPNPSNGLVYVEHRRSGEVTVVSAAPSLDVAEAFIETIERALPRRVPRDDSTVAARFWFLTGNGPRSVTRRVFAPTFPEVRGNYAATVAASLDRLTGPSFEPGKGGQLILWHGLPGTGKTWALRALAQSWASWCRIDYVVDPEAFFGKAAYLMSVLLESDDYDHDDPKAGWRLLILEDTGELLSSDARERAGQGLSRLLNTVDGFIGQGLRILILITTNEELGKLHPAVARPGRCAMTVGFSALDVPTARQWAAKHGIPTPRSSKTLAELFAIRDGFEKGDVPRSIGFGDAAA